MERSILLVHGAWHGAWCFDRVTALLAEAGADCRAIDLPGHGASAAPLGDLHGDAAAVRAALDASDAPVVLAGHSYGGAVITEAGNHPAVDHLLYICAFALDAGEACNRAAAAQAEALGLDATTKLNAAIVREGGLLTLDPVAARAALYNDCDDAAASWAIARLGPQPVVTLAQPPDAVAWRHKPATYALCTADQAVHPELQRLLAARCTAAVEWPTGHSPFLSRPDLVAACLLDLARR